MLKKQEAERLDAPDTDTGADAAMYVAWREGRNGLRFHRAHDTDLGTP